jgi:hypothetical protein
VSGVTFTVGPQSVRRHLDGQTLYFCCEACAGYFDAHRARVIAARRLPTRQVAAGAAARTK